MSAAYEVRIDQSKLNIQWEIVFGTTFSENSAKIRVLVRLTHQCPSVKWIFFVAPAMMRFNNCPHTTREGFFWSEGEGGRNRREGGSSVDICVEWSASAGWRLYKGRSCTEWTGSCNRRLMSCDCTPTHRAVNSQSASTWTEAMREAAGFSGRRSSPNTAFLQLRHL